MTHTDATSKLIRFGDNETDTKLETMPTRSTLLVSTVGPMAGFHTNNIGGVHDRTNGMRRTDAHISPVETFPSTWNGELKVHSEATNISLYM